MVSQNGPTQGAMSSKGALRGHEVIETYTRYSRVADEEQKNKKRP